MSGKYTRVEKDAPEAICTVCSGTSFHILLVGTHNHFKCANPICGESVCQGGHCECDSWKWTCKRCYSCITLKDVQEHDGICAECRDMTPPDFADANVAL